MFLEAACSVEKTVNVVNSQNTHILFQISGNKGTKNILQINTNHPALTSIEKLKVVIKCEHRQASGGRNSFGNNNKKKPTEKKEHLIRL